MEQTESHGGELALDGLEGFGVEALFTLSGGHLFPLFDAAVRRGLRIVDVRHEQTAVFAAEATAKLTRCLGVAALTAGPGVTNGISAITSAWIAGSPLLVLGGRAPEQRFGSGSLQELDHVPILAPITKWATTATSTATITALVAEAARVAMAPHCGPVALDLPLDVLFASVPARSPAARGASEPGAGRVVPVPSASASSASASGAMPLADEALLSRVAGLLVGAQRPVMVVGSDAYFAHAEHALRRLAEELWLPVFANGLGRGMLPADHELAFARARSLQQSADVVLVVGAPLDFRLGFGHFGDAKVIHIVDDHGRRAMHLDVELTIAGDLNTALTALSELAPASGAAGARAAHGAFLAELREAELGTRAADEELLGAEASPIHPARIYGELRKRLERDAVVIGDGGDFVSFAGRYIDSYEPGTFLDPGPYGCLGTGLGYAIAARLAHPQRQVVLCSGDGAFGFAGLDVDSLVRHGLPVVIVIGNNGTLGLEQHPMRALYGYDVAATLQPRCRYDEVVRALGGAGEIVDRAEAIGPALDRAFGSGVPYCVNVVTDPEVAYPRRTNLA